MLIVTFGLAVWKSATVLSQNALPGPVVALCQKVIVTGPPLELVPPLSSLPPPPQATKLMLDATAAATARAFLDAMNLTSRLRKVSEVPRDRGLKYEAPACLSRGCSGIELPKTFGAKPPTCTLFRYGRNRWR